MAKPYDATTKQLVDLNPAHWLRFLGLPMGAVTAFDADLSTITTEADRVLRVEALVPYLAHLEFQTTYKGDMIERFLRYYVLLRYRYNLPVQTVLFLLRPAEPHRIGRRTARRHPRDGAAHHARSRPDASGYTLGIDLQPSGFELPGGIYR